jgi:hypothetical protein
LALAVLETPAFHPKGVVVAEILLRRRNSQRRRCGCRWCCFGPRSGQKEFSAPAVGFNPAPAPQGVIARRGVVQARAVADKRVVLPADVLEPDGLPEKQLLIAVVLAAPAL